jgi:glycosyltransferase involved in cell wall biosynthesis
MPKNVAILIPCRNESAAIARVVAEFRAALSDAKIYVYDNNSTDTTAEIARAAGAIVRAEKLQGKGHVVRRMFADIEADIYVLVDGDGTYDPGAAPAMVAMLEDQHLDMVTGIRFAAGDQAAYRRFHRSGNILLTALVRYVFGNRVTDMLSGYRVFSRRFVKSFPALSSGFETETELTVHALALDMPLGEITVAYGARSEGSSSKLRTYADGLRILRRILLLVKDERPGAFFGSIGTILMLLGIAAGVPVVVEFARTGLVPRLPTAVLATGLVLVSCLSFVCGLVLDSVARGRKEAKRLAYLRIPRDLL